MESLAPAEEEPDCLAKMMSTSLRLIMREKSLSMRAKTRRAWSSELSILRVSLMVRDMALTMMPTIEIIRARMATDTRTSTSVKARAAGEGGEKGRDLITVDRRVGFIRALEMGGKCAGGAIFLRRPRDDNTHEGRPTVKISSVVGGCAAGRLSGNDS